jgi:hypothetical protein
MPHKRLMGERARAARSGKAAVEIRCAATIRRNNDRPCGRLLGGVWLTPEPVLVFNIYDEDPNIKVYKETARPLAPGETDHIPADTGEEAYLVKVLGDWEVPLWCPRHGGMTVGVGAVRRRMATQRRTGQRQVLTAHAGVAP